MTGGDRASGGSGLPPAGGPFANRFCDAVDRLKEIGAARWIRRKTKKSLERLRKIFEEPRKEPLKRASIAGYDSAKAARFGAATGMDPARSGPE